jgi:hypothetical protein
MRIINDASQRKSVRLSEAMQANNLHNAWDTDIIHYMLAFISTSSQKLYPGNWYTGCARMNGDGKELEKSTAPLLIILGQ